jgi:hypothetical protein
VKAHPAGSVGTKSSKQNSLQVSQASSGSALGSTGSAEGNNGQAQTQSPADAQMTQQLQTILQLLKTHVAQPKESEVKFNKKLLDNFDYSDDEDGGGAGDQNDSQLSPAVLESLQG